METNILFLIISRSVFLGMRMFQTKVVEKIKTHILCPITFFLENCVVWEIMWNYIVQPHRTQTTTWRMRIACWITKATNTLSQYVILVVFLLQQWLHKRASVHCLSCPLLPSLDRAGIAQLRARRSEDRIPVGAKFPAPVQTGSGSHPAYCTMGTGSLSQR